MGQRSLSACSWMRTIFSTVRRPQEPAFTVESLAMTATTRPPILPRPVITPSAGRSTSFALAKAPSSTKLSASSSMRTRSRANSFPVSAFFWWYFGAPPFSMRACSALALSSNPIAGALLAHPPVGGYTCPHAPPSGGGHALRTPRRRLISRLPFPARLSTTLRLWKKNNLFFRITGSGLCGAGGEPSRRRPTRAAARLFAETRRRNRDRLAVVAWVGGAELHPRLAIVKHGLPVSEA